MIIGIAGSGVMGRGIAQLFVQSGHEVRLFDARAGAAREAHDAVVGMLERLAAKGAVSRPDLAGHVTRLRTCSEIGELAGCEVIVEAIIEELGPKQALFGELEAIAGESAILDPARTLGIDPLARRDRRRVLMTAPATRPERRDAVHALLAAGGVAVTVIADSPGFVAQRVIAMIVNIACEIAQRGIAGAAEIDPAIRLGLGYPAGPLELGDRIGPLKILQILETIQTITGDPRYRPSVWLRRRALSGLSLLHEAG